MKKILLTLLALLMVFGMMMPISAEGDSENVAKIGDVNYSSLEEALKAAKTGETVTLLNNVTESVVIENGKNIILDLNGKTITNIEGKHTITNKGTLTIKGEGTVDNVSDDCAALMNNGSAIIEGGNFTRSKETGTSPAPEGEGGNSWYVIKNDKGATMTFDGGNVTSSGKHSSLVDNYGTMVINDGNFSNGFIAIKAEEDTKLTINGGNITGAQSIQTYGETLVNGGTLSGDVTVINYENFPSKTTFEGGELVDGNIVIKDDLSQRGKYPTTAEISLNVNDVEIKNGGIKVQQVSEDLSTTEVDIEQLNNVKADVTGGSFKQDVSKYVSDSASFIAVDSVYYAGSEEELQEKAKGATSSVEAIKGIDELKDVPENVTVTNKTGNDIIVNDQKVEDGKDVVVKPEEKPEPEDKPSTPSISCAGSKDKNCDGVVTCEEEKGKGWIWNNTKKVCEYNPNAYTVVNTGVK